MDELFRKLFNLLEKRWYRTSTIFLLIPATILLLLGFFSAIKLEEVSTVEILIGFLIFLGIVIFWFLSTRIPKAPKGKIGFALGIIADSPDQQQKLKNSFFQTLRDLLNKSKYKYSFVFIEIPNYFIDKIASPDDAIKTLHDARCSFMVYGKARTITMDGKEQQILNLEGVVAHRPIPNEISKSFSKEFGELFPKRMAISSEGDLFQFEITAQWIDVVSKYIIGTAALLSGDIVYSQELFENLQQVLQSKNVGLPALIKIKQRLPSRLEDVYLVQLKILYEEWNRSKDSILIDKMKPLVEKLNVVSPRNLDARFYKSILYFLNGRNIGKAKTETLKAQKQNKKHTTWQYNYAFLLAYEGNMQEAVKQYEVAVTEVFEEPRVVLEIIEFIMWVLDVEPDKTQLHFCLGLIYYYAIKDYALALKDFEKFIEVTPANRFSSQRREARRLILKIQKDIKSGKLKFENEINV